MLTTTTPNKNTLNNDFDSLIDNKPQWKHSLKWIHLRKSINYLLIPANWLFFARIDSAKCFTIWFHWNFHLQNSFWFDTTVEKWRCHICTHSNWLNVPNISHTKDLSVKQSKHCRKIHLWMRQKQRTGHIQSESTLYQFVYIDKKTKRLSNPL